MAEMQEMDASSASTPRSRAMVLLPAYITVFVDFLGYSATVVVLPYISMEQNATAFEVMCATSGVFYAGQMAGCLSRGIDLSELEKEEEDVYMLMLARLFGGIMGGTLPVVQAMVLDIVTDPEERAGCLSRVNASFGMAFAVGPALGAGVNELFGKKAVFVVVAVLGCICSAFAGYMLEETLDVSLPGNASRRIGRGTAASLQRTVWLASAAMLMTAYAFSALTSALPLFYVPMYHWGPRELGMVATGFGLSMAFYNIMVTKPIIKLFGAPRASMFASMLMGTAVLVCSMVPFPFVHVIFMLSEFAIGWALQLPALSEMIAKKVSPEQRGAAMGMLVSALSLGRAVSPFTTGYLYKASWLVAPYTEQDVFDPTMREVSITNPIITINIIMNIDYLSL
eukprot:jgi/Bigna1/140112/aug1.54_g14820